MQAGIKEAETKMVALHNTVAVRDMMIAQMTAEVKVGQCRLNL
jgi:hypothetical protein